MGRMLETFTQADGWRNRINGEEEPLPLPVPPAPEAEADAADDWEPEDESLPFVEVGGPRPGRPAPAPAVAAARPEPERPAVPGLLTIRFQPWPIAATRDRRFAPELVAYHHPDHAVSEQYRSLAGAVAGQLRDGQTRLALFTGAAPAAGTTTVVLNLAITLARTPGTKVAVVEANPVSPAIGERLGLDSGPGLRELLSKTAPLAWVLRASGLEGLSALPVGKPADGPLPEGPLPALLERLRGQFDWILVDAPAWGASPEAEVLSGLCDATYLVLRQGGLDEADMDSVQQAIADRGGQLRGFVLTEQ
jgi:Mrp family chromosome partitioning ATPase